MLLRVAEDFLDFSYPAWMTVGVTELWPTEAVVELGRIAVLGQDTH